MIQTFTSEDLELARSQLSFYEQSRADVVALAMLASLARRVEPELLRVLRLSLGNKLDGKERPTVATEAALWFSPLVESRGPDSITFLPEYRNLLWNRLISHDQLLESAYTILQECHELLAPAIRWEEQLVYLGLSNQFVSPLHQNQAITQSIWPAIKAVESGNRPGLEKLILDMGSRLPETARLNQLFFQLQTSLRRKYTYPSEIATPLDFSTIPTIFLDIQLKGNRFLIGDIPGSNFELKVPALKPVQLNVFTTNEPNSDPTPYVIPEDSWIEIPIQTNPIRLITADGQVYLLDPVEFQTKSRTDLKQLIEDDYLHRSSVINLPNYHTSMASLRETSYNRPNLFIVSSNVGLSVANAIKSNFDKTNDVDIWTENVFALNKGTFNNLINRAYFYDFAIFVLTPDDNAIIKDKELKIFSDNFHFELGLFSGAIGPNRVFCIAEESVYILSDFSGISRATYRSKDNLVAAVSNACLEIKREMEITERVYRFSILPSTSLAIGYYKNFLEKVNDAFSQVNEFEIIEKDLSGNVINKQTVKIKDRFPSITVLLPRKLSDLQPDFLARKTKSLTQVIVNSTLRSYQFYIEGNVSEDNIFFFDIPITLLASLETINAIFSPDFLVIDNNMDLIQRREISNFEKTIRMMASVSVENGLIKFADLE